MTTLAKQLDRLCRGNRQRVEVLAESLLAAEWARQAALVDSTSRVPQTACPPTRWHSGRTASRPHHACNGSDTYRAASGAALAPQRSRRQTLHLTVLWA